MENLFEVMQEIIDKNMKDHKEDFDIDKTIMLNKENEDEFYWYVRRSGTDIYEAEKVQFKESEENISANYYIGYDALKVFHIKIEKRGTKYVYGSIEPVKREKFEIMITKDVKIIREKKIRIIFNDGFVVEGQYTGDIESREIINNILTKNKKDMNDLKSFKVLEYFS
jgi:hypothetical protein